MRRTLAFSLEITKHEWDFQVWGAMYSEWRDERRGLVRQPLQLPGLEKMKAWPGSVLAGWFPHPACGPGSRASHGRQPVVQEAEAPLGDSLWFRKLSLPWGLGQGSLVGSLLSPRLRLGCQRGKAAFVSSRTMLTDSEFAASQFG